MQCVAITADATATVEEDAENDVFFVHSRVRAS